MITACLGNRSTCETVAPAARYRPCPGISDKNSTDVASIMIASLQSKVVRSTSSSWAAQLCAERSSRIGRRPP